MEEPQILAKTTWQKFLLSPESHIQLDPQHVSKTRKAVIRDLQENTAEVCRWLLPYDQGFVPEYTPAPNLVHLSLPLTGN